MMMRRSSTGKTVMQQWSMDCDSEVLTRAAIENNNNNMIARGEETNSLEKQSFLSSHKIWTATKFVFFIHKQT